MFECFVFADKLPALPRGEDVCRSGAMGVFIEQ